MTARTVNQRGRANFYRPGSNNVICDRTGFKIKVENARKEWNNLVVRDKSFERRQPQDLIRSFPDKQQPKISRPGNEDVFLTTTDVTEEDL